GVGGPRVVCASGGGAGARWRREGGPSWGGGEGYSALPASTGPTGWSWYSKEVTTPKLPPPPRRPQKRSGCSLALAWRNWPSAVTISAARRVSQARPYLPASQPRPPPSGRPAMPVLETTPPLVAQPKACGSASKAPPV